MRTGRHEGDWEAVQVELDRRQRPQRAVFSQHSWAEACAWGRVEHPTGAPVVYVANGSHASYATAGEHGRPWPDPDDQADGRGRTVRPELVRISGGHPAWVAWPGRWGRSQAGLVPGEKSSPRGPAFQSDGPWPDPDAFVSRARACGTGAPPLPAAALLAAGLLAGLLGVLAGVRLGLRSSRARPPSGRAPSAGASRSSRESA